MADETLHRVTLTLCRACIDGVGDECHWLTVEVTR
jgi:hypothetical protein